MRLLKLRIDGALLFCGHRLELDFVATDRVPRDEEGNIADVTALYEGSTVYTQNVLALVGVNASGKTTALNYVRLVLGYMSGAYSMRRFATYADRLGKLGDELTISCVFFERGRYYLIESKLRHSVRKPGDSALGEGGAVDAFTFEDETLWKHPGSQVTRRVVTDVDLFREQSEVLLRRCGPEGDDKVLEEAQRTFLGDDMSIVSVVTGKRSTPVQRPERSLPLISMPTPVIQAFDPSVEYLNWNVENQVFHLKFKNEDRERVLSASMAASVLSNGTVLGAELVDRAITVLGEGGYLIVDEIETGLNRSLVATVIELFASPVTNPKGATLLFSTHYPELLDVLRRKDNVYVLARDASFLTQTIKYSERIKRIENKKSEVLINNVIKGSMPKYPDVQAMREFVCEHVNG